MKKIFSKATLNMPTIKIHDVYFDKGHGGVVLHITKGDQPTELVRMYEGDILEIQREVSIKVTESPNQWRS